MRIDQLSRDFKSGVDSASLGGGARQGQQRRDASEEGAAADAGRRSRRSSRVSTARLKEGRAARMAARPAVAHYRLSRKEYQNTVYDLLGVRYDPAKPGELNEDTLWHGFERIGSELSLSPSHVDRYYRAAELVLDRAFPVDVAARLARSARPRRSCVTAAGRTSRRRWTGSASSGRCVTCSFPAMSRTRSRPTGSARPGRSTAGSTKSASRPAAFARSAASRRT